MKKLLSSKWIVFFSGFVLGLFVVILYMYGNNINNSFENEYYKLKDDYCVDDIGFLKSGTLLRVDKGMSEGFTRYVLYLNISDGEDLVKYKTKEKDMIIPYWLNIKDTTCEE
jgi:hypothetical protein